MAATSSKTVKKTDLWKVYLPITGSLLVIAMGVRVFVSGIGTIAGGGDQSEHVLGWLWWLGVLVLAGAGTMMYFTETRKSAASPALVGFLLIFAYYGINSFVEYQSSLPGVAEWSFGRERGDTESDTSPAEQLLRAAIERAPAAIEMPLCIRDPAADSAGFRAPHPFDVTNDDGWSETVTLDNSMMRYSLEWPAPIVARRVRNSPDEPWRAVDDEYAESVQFAACTTMESKSGEMMGIIYQ